MPNFRLTKAISTDPKIENPKELGLKIKDARLRKGLSQQELSIRVSAIPQSLKRLECGMLIYEPPYMTKLLKFLGLNEKGIK